MSTINSVNYSVGSTYVTFTINCTLDASNTYRRASVTYGATGYSSSTSYAESGSYTFTARLGTAFFSSGYNTVMVVIQYSSDGNTWQDSNDLYTTVSVYIDDDSSSSTTTYYYRCYDATNSTYLTSSTSTTSTSITRPTQSGYTYVGYVYHSSWSKCISQSSYDGTGTTCSSHSSTYPYVVFFYTANNSSSVWSGWTQLVSSVLAPSATTSYNYSISLSAGYVGFLRIKPTVAGTLTVYTTGSYDTYGWLTDGNCSLGTGNGGNALTDGTIYTKDDDSGTNNNFNYSCEVTANTIYEIDVHAYNYSTAVSPTLYINFVATPTTWQAPIIMAGYTLSGSTSYTASNTSSVAKYQAGYVRVYCAYAGSITFKTTSGGTSPDYYSYLAYATSTTSPLSAGSSTTRSAAVNTSATGYLTNNDDCGDGTYDTSITYTVTGGRYYYWYVNAAWASTGTYSIPWSFTYTPTTYTITFNANGGSGAPSTQSGSAGSSITLSTTQPTRSGYRFLGWSMSSTAISATWKVGISHSFTLGTNYTLYAVWRPVFSWTNKDITEANQLIGYMNTYFSAGLSALSTNELIKASWYNTIANLLSVSTVTQYTDKITSTALEALATAFNSST